MRLIRSTRLLAAWIVLAALLAACSSDDNGGGSWTATWIQAPHAADAPVELSDQTLRQGLRVSLGGRRLRVRLSNRFSPALLRVAAVSVARSSGGSPLEDVRAVWFDGQAAVDIEPGGEVLSDPLEFPVVPLEEVVVSLYFAQVAAVADVHAVSLRSPLIADGDQTMATELAGVGAPFGWAVVNAVEVSGGPSLPVVVAFGDSITDGVGSLQANGSWPERLAGMVAGVQGILNAGISGNRILREGRLGFGPSALNRLDFDVLSHPGVTAVVLLEGINDLQAPAVPSVFGDDPGSPRVTAAELIEGARQIIERCRDAGLIVVGGTLVAYDTLDRLIDGGEAERTAYNEWIRNSGEFDAVIDFDAATRDPMQPTRLLPEYDSGDTLHPSDAGYQAMAEAAFAVLSELP